jgi:hypothetical protein
VYKAGECWVKCLECLQWYRVLRRERT